MEPERFRQVERLYHAALGREASQRSAFLEETCGGDTSLRREVESLLAHSAATSFLNSPAIELAGKVLAQENSRRRQAEEMGQRKLGNTVSHYRILEKLGSGGMGEVYRATDTKLGRDVALKILPEAFAKNAERMARFRREAQLLASLNHPNIATIHGLEESAGNCALVMELVEGRTLAERISSATARPTTSGEATPTSNRILAGVPMPLDEALSIANQITEGIEYAHERGVIHRDLKPANVKVRPDGAVKILDFGLAKTLEETPAAASINASPTASISATRAGLILGTAAYMSPEQARGKTVDRRCDIWSFGALLFEMLSGKQAFHGEDVSETLAAVITKEPDW
jgi:eukaryotic-like serine/threonine-protein kinase